jgi:hypothetical protein
VFGYDDFDDEYYSEDDDEDDEITRIFEGEDGDDDEH